MFKRHSSSRVLGERHGDGEKTAESVRECCKEEGDDSKEYKR